MKQMMDRHCLCDRSIDEAHFEFLPFDDLPNVDVDY